MYGAADLANKLVFVAHNLVDSRENNGTAVIPVGSDSATVEWTEGGKGVMLNALALGEYTLTETSGGSNYARKVFVKDNHETDADSLTFTITGNEVSGVAVKVINKEQTGSLTVNKVVEANTLNEAETYTFELVGPGAKGTDGSKTYVGTIKTATGGEVAWTLDGKPVSLESLPLGSYTISETVPVESNYKFKSFKVGDSEATTTNGAQITLSAEKAEITVTATNTVKADGSFKVSKRIYDQFGQSRTNPAAESLWVAVYLDGADGYAQVKELTWNTAAKQYNDVAFTSLAYGSYTVRELVKIGESYYRADGQADFSYTITGNNAVVVLNKDNTGAPTSLATIENTERTAKVNISAEKNLSNADKRILADKTFQLELTRTDGGLITTTSNKITLTLNSANGWKQELMQNLPAGTYSISELTANSNGEWVNTALSGSVGGSAITVTGTEETGFAGEFTISTKNLGQTVAMEVSSTNKATSKYVAFSLTKASDTLDTAEKTFSFGLYKGDTIVATGTIEKTMAGAEKVVTWKSGAGGEGAAVWNPDTYLWETGKTYKVVELNNNDTTLTAVTSPSGTTLTEIKEDTRLVGVAFEVNEGTTDVELAFGNTQNKFTPGLTLQKKVVDSDGRDVAYSTSNWPGASFQFVLYTKVMDDTQDPAVEIEKALGVYTISNGTAITLTTSEELKAGATYYLKENRVSPVGGYQIQSISAMDKNSNPTGTWDNDAKVFTFQAQTGIQFTATNKIMPAALTIEKVRVGGADKAFAFTVSVDNTPYTGACTIYTPVEGGDPTKTPSNLTAGALSLKGGQWAELTDVVVGQSYSVKETKVGGYTTTVTGGTFDEDTNTATGTITLGSKVTFTNTYGVSANLTLGAVKTVSGTTQSVAGKFTFVLSETTTATDVTKVLASPTTITCGEAGAAVNFPQLTFNQTHVAAGTSTDHTFTIAEQTGTQAGFTYSKDVYTVVVRLSDNGEGTFTAKVQSVKKGTTDVADAISEAGTLVADKIAFQNTYSASGSLALTATKAVPGATIADAAGKFTFAVKEGDTVVATGTNLASGSINFSAINYTAAGDHTYTVQETTTASDGFTMDSAKYTFNVKVADQNNGQLTAKVASISKPGLLNIPVSISAEDVVFTNNYTATGRVTIKAGKLTPGRATIPADKFSFTLTETGLGEDGTGKKVLSNSIKNVAGGAISYTVNFTQNSTTQAVGTHTYLLTENSGHESGYTCDATAYRITVTVSDNHDGTLAAAITSVTRITADGESAIKVDAGSYNATTADGAVFTNRYEATGSLKLSGTKTTPGGSELGTDDFAGKFTFTVKEGAATVATATNLKYGKFIFSPITYTQNGDVDAAKPVLGQHTYTITEDNVTVDGYTNSTVSYIMKVTVSDEGNGKLKASITDLQSGGETVAFQQSYAAATGVTTLTSAAAVTFANEYEATGNVTLRATKVFIGASATDYAGKFSFTVSELSGDTESAPIATATNLANGDITFNAITYTQNSSVTETAPVLGEHTYLLREVVPADADKVAGCVYDTTTYLVKVNVSDNKDGTLKAIVTGITKQTYAAGSDTPSKTHLTVRDEGVYEAGDVSFTNAFTRDLAIYKHARRDEKNKLANAEFKLYREVVTATNLVATMTTNKDGYATATDLTVGKYILVETKYPSGYYAVQKEHAVTLTADAATQSIVVELAENDKCATVDASTGVIKVSNDRDHTPDTPNQPESPDTGDHSRSTLYGCLSVASVAGIAGVFAKLRKRKKEEQ